MSGFEAITHHNGWAMAIVGATIVLSGLTILSLIISQLHKVIDFYEKKSAPTPVVNTDQNDKNETTSLFDGCPTNIDATADSYRPLIEELEEDFQLADLYSLAHTYNLPHPHLSIRCLRDAGRLIAKGDGVFNWNA